VSTSLGSCSPTAAFTSSWQTGTPTINDAEVRALDAIMAMLASIMWPVVLVGYMVWRFATPVTPGERKAELDERERRIQELERELGIGRDSSG
jgi:hypothetical protein